MNDELNRARRLFAEGHHTDALAVLHNQNIYDADASQLAGEFLYCMEEYAKAADAYKAAVAQSPESAVCSKGCFISNWDAGNYPKAFDEIERFAEIVQATYDPLIKALIEHLNNCGEAIETDATLGIPGAYSREAKRLNPRYHTDRNPLEHLNGLKRKQNQIQKGKGKTKGIIDSTKKSEQAVNVELSRIRSVADVHDSPLLNSTDENLS